MDRRQRKTREAIFRAFIELLSQKHYTHITVGEIITRADIGRATFYSHFETKDFLLKELCEELFCHIFDSLEGNTKHHHLFECEAPNSVFLHIFKHLEKNDNNILQLFSCQNNEIFLEYFKQEFRKLVKNQLKSFETNSLNTLPLDFKINHITATFVETVRWWVANNLEPSSETINGYFLTAINIPQINV